MSSASAILQDTFGYPSFRGQQQAIVEHLIAGGDAMVLMPTGGGKSLCYQIPALARPGLAVVVSPLIALMQDQVDALLELDIKAAYLNSSQSTEQARQVLRDAGSGRLKLLYVAPERLLTDGFLDMLHDWQARHGLALFAIDEAHCVSQWGHDFRPEYIQLGLLCELFPEVPRVALTATADAHTRQEIVERLKLQQAAQFVASFDRPNIRYQVVEKDEPKRQLLDFLQGESVYGGTRDSQSGIVYCLSRRKVEDTAAWLTEQGIPALPYHAGMDQALRREHQQRFLREEGLIMVATIAFGMGIDKPDVRFVAHLDLPKSLESYYQETGRAGRDGLPAEAWMAYGLQDVVQLRQWIDTSEAPETVRRIEGSKLDAMLGYCETPSCRRVVLLGYFGEASEGCGNCDRCLDPPEVIEGTVAAQKLMSAALRTGQRFGAAHLIDLLVGKMTDKMKQYGHDQLPTFGVGTEFDAQGWRSVLRQLVAAGLLRADPARHGAITLTEDARPVLKGERQIQLRKAAPRAARRKAAKSRTGAAAPVALQGTAAEQRFAHLKAWRLKRAREAGVPPYVVFHDATLMAIASLAPENLAALAQIPGLGAAKRERYGMELLALLGVTD